MQPFPGRRRFVQSAAATGSFLACSSVIDRSRAQVPVRITPPVVDKLTIQAAVDSNHDIFISGASANDVEVERVRSPASFNCRAPDSQWGLSLHLVSSNGKDTRRYLLDFAFTPQVLNNNPALLKIDPATLDALILSHGHLDHFGSLMGFLPANRAGMREMPIDHVIPMHCSGGSFIQAARREMPEKLILCTTGSRFTFTA
jgi:7,8-dihydropterin-6-yl-methyl-4-(beta-D-ribofuranosyl)aminobenzene 5'-phosphate synthase